MRKGLKFKESLQNQKAVYIEGFSLSRPLLAKVPIFEHVFGYSLVDRLVEEDP